MTTTRPAGRGSPVRGADPPGRATRRAFALLGTVQVTLIFTITLVAVPLPAIGREFGLGTSGLVLVSAAYGLAFSGLLLFGGRLADRFGGRPLFTTGLAVFAVGSAVAAAAPDTATLIAARFTEGIGAALTAPAAMTLLPRLFPDPGRHARAMATWGGLSVLGATAGIVLSGVVTTWVSWRWMFVIAVLVSLTARLLTPRWLPATGPPRRRPALDPPGAVLATAGITLLSYGLVISGGHAWSRASVLIPIAAGLGLLAAFAVAESRRRDPLLPAAFAAMSRPRPRSAR
ncbi:MAG TPA: MFS transporter [Streptosporangiaceae bacterium]